MVNDILRLESLNLEEVAGVVSIYPWFGAARKELCRRMAELGPGAWSDERYAQEALYVGSRKLIYDLARGKEKADLSDKEIGELLNSYFTPAESGDEIRKIVVVGGDYFSQKDYDSVRKEDDNYFAGFCPDADAPAKDVSPIDEFTDFCTESLAKVYLDQGYPDAARKIYSQLSLRYPEKSVYFATLIEKIDNKI